MTDIQMAGREFEGHFCRKCGEEVASFELIHVDRDGESDGDGHTRDLTTIQHEPTCPEDGT